MLISALGSQATCLHALLMVAKHDDILNIDMLEPRQKEVSAIWCQSVFMHREDNNSTMVALKPLLHKGHMLL